MLDAILMILLGGLCGYLIGSICDYYKREDTQIVRDEATYLCDRLEALLTEVKQLNASK